MGYPPTFPPGCEIPEVTVTDLTPSFRLPAASDPLIVSAIIVGYALACFLTFSGFLSQDLSAVYMAAHNFAIGNLDGIYASRTPLFDFSVPPEWKDQASLVGLSGGQQFPFVYPPLWAAVLAPLTTICGGESFLLFASFLNPVLLGLSAVLSHRILRPKMRLAYWVAIALLLVTVTSIGHIALVQSQPQILVSFLILLAFERDRSGHMRSAGVALALAASIKLYPALFAFFWLARGNWRAFLTFLLAGAGLASSSVLLAGWSLHQEYLDRVFQIADTIISAPFIYNLDALIGQWQEREMLRNLGNPTEFERVTNLIVGQKLNFVRLLDRLLLVAGMTALVIAFIRSRTDEERFGRLLPAGLLFVSLVSPLSWAYHFLSVAFFFPIFIERYTHGRVFIFAIVLVFNFVPNWPYDYIPSPFFLGQPVGLAAMIAILILFLRMPAERSQPE